MARGNPLPERLEHCQAVLYEFSHRLRLASLSRVLSVPVSEIEQWPARTVEEFLTISEALAKASDNGG